MAAAVLLDCMFIRKMRIKRRRIGSSSRSVSLKFIHEENHEQTKCRICLEDGNIPIFEENSQSAAENVVSNIKTFGEIEVSEDDELPKMLCRECLELLQSAVRFRELAQESERILRSLEINIQSSSNYNEERETNEDPVSRWSDDEEKSSSFQCRRCQLDFTSVGELLSHRRSDTHARPRAQCHDCGASVCRGSMAAHVARRHTRAHSHMCHVCAKGFAVKGSLKRHLMIHTDELPYSCDACAYRCRYRASLAEHTRTHTGERPYACHRCPARFPSASNLKKHTRTHQDSHELKCAHCNKGFHTQHKMKAHIKVEHLGLREHVCELCGKQFGYKEKLGQHLKNVHKRPKKRSGRTPLYLEIEEKMRQSGQSTVQPG